MRAPGSGRYIAPLDGLRAVSILLVVFSHLGVRYAPGIFGVTIFFFISGFLITGLLLQELDGTGRIALPMFYVRRALRLYPALLALVAVGGIAFLGVGGLITVTDLLGSVLYLTNILENFGAYSSGIPHAPHIYAALWSLALEEHYYLVFPLLVVLLARRRGAFIVALVGLTALVFAWRWHVATECWNGGCSEYRVEHGTDTRIDSILFGALFATLLASRWRAITLQWLGNVPAGLLGVLLLLLALVVRDPWFRVTSRFLVQGLGLLLLIGAVLYAPGLAWARTVLSWRPCLLMGRLSYSFYLWHWAVLCIALPLLPHALAAPIITQDGLSVSWVATVMAPLLLLSFALAAISYYGIELPMVAVRRRFGSHAIAEAASGNRRELEPPKRGRVLPH